MVLTLEGGVVRTVFVEVPGEIADSAVVDGDARCSTSGSPGSRCARFAARSPRGCATRAPTRRVASCSISLCRKASSCSTPRCRWTRRQRRARRRRRCSPSSRSFRRRDRMRRLLALTETPQALGEAIRKRVASTPGISHHDRRRARRSAPRGLHRRHRRVSRRVARRRDRRHRPDAHAVRQSHLARQHTSRLLSDLLE